MPKIHEKSAGFTLIEVLVTSLILGVLVSALTPLLWQGQRSWEDSRGQIEIQSNLRQVLDYLTKELHQADARVNEAGPKLILNGASDFQYTSSVHGGMYRVYLDGTVLKRQYLGTPGHLLSEPQEDLMASPEVEIQSFNIWESDQIPGMYQLRISGRFRQQGALMTIQTQVTPRVR